MYIESKRNSGLYVEGNIAYYFRRDDPTPFILDTRFIKESIRVSIRRNKPAKDMHGLHADQEFSHFWPDMAAIHIGDNSKNIKRLIMEERNIPDSVSLRIVTKFLDGNKRNMLSENLVLAEQMAVASVTSVDRMREYCYYYCYIQNKKISVKKESLGEVFRNYCRNVSHPVVMSLDGVLIYRDGC